MAAAHAHVSQCQTALTSAIANCSACKSKVNSFKIKSQPRQTKTYKWSTETSTSNPRNKNCWTKFAKQDKLKAWKKQKEKDSKTKKQKVQKTKNKKVEKCSIWI